MSQCDTPPSRPEVQGGQGHPRAGGTGWGSPVEEHVVVVAKPSEMSEHQVAHLETGQRQLQSPEATISPLNALLVDSAGPQPVQLSMQQQMSQLHDCSRQMLYECWTYTYVQGVTPATVRDHNLLVKKTATRTPRTQRWGGKNPQVHLVTGRGYSSSLLFYNSAHKQRGQMVVTVRRKR